MERCQSATISRPLIVNETWIIIGFKKHRYLRSIHFETALEDAADAEACIHLFTPCQCVTAGVARGCVPALLLCVLSNYHGV